MLQKNKYPNLNIFKNQYKTCGHASWIYEYEVDDKVYYHYCNGMACYADMRSNYLRMKGLTLRKIYNCVRCRDDMRGIAKDYWEFLIDPKISPYRNVIKNGVELVQEGTIEYWVFPVENNMSSQSLVSLFMALREVNEYPNFPRLWHYLINKGWDEVEAFYASSYFFLNDRNEITMGSADNHHIFSNYSNNSLKRLKEADPFINKKYTLDNTYSGVQIIWTSDGKYNLLQQTPPIYDRVKSDKGYIGQFKKLFNAVNKYKMVKLMKFPKPEEFAKMRDLIIAE